MSVISCDSMTEGPAEVRLRGSMLLYHGPVGAFVLCADVSYPEGGVPQLRGGFPITREQLEVLTRGIQDRAPTRAVLPANVVMWDGLRLAWWTPAARRRIWFDERQQPQLRHVSRQEVMHPPLLFVVERKRLHLFALSENERPSAETPLFQAPYLNTYPDGWVCSEGFDWPGTVDLDSIPQWERTFFGSEGTKVWAQRLTSFPGGHDALWNAMLTAAEFPADSLIPMGMTLLDAINQERRGTYPELAPREEIVPVKELQP